MNREGAKLGGGTREETVDLRVTQVVGSFERGKE